VPRTAKNEEQSQASSTRLKKRLRVDRNDTSSLCVAPIAVYEG